VNWPMPSLRDEASGFTASGRITNRVDALSPTNSFTTGRSRWQHDQCHWCGQSWSFTYDEDNRVTSLNWDCGITLQVNTNRYDAMGRRIARTVTVCRRATYSTFLAKWNESCAI